MGYGGPAPAYQTVFPAWDSKKAYALDDRVYYQGYLYQAMTSISPGDDPRTATFTNSGVTFRKWTIYDLPSTYLMARLRGIPDNSISDESGVASPMPYEVRTICVRNFFQSDESFQEPTSKSLGIYGMPQGMDSNWAQTEYWDPVYAPSAAAYADGKPKSYPYPASMPIDSGIVFQPNTVSAQLLSDLNMGSPEDYLAPAWSTETQGQMISCYQTFSREYGFALVGTAPYTGDESNTTSFQDNWEAQRPWTGYSGGFFIKYTDPNFKDV